MLIEIKNYRTGNVIFSHECESMRECVLKAYESGAVLRGADLSDADLSDAILSDANLSYAILRGADLSGAILRGADLSGAILSDANLSDAILSDANLSYAILSYAILRGADLSDAILSDANLSDAILSYAILNGADLSDAKGIATNEESIARLDEIREHIIVHGDQLKMGSWHGTGWNPSCGPEHACQTSHCLAGWAQALCPDAAMRKLDPVTAGVRLIPLAAGRFWDDDEKTKAWLEAREYAKAGI